MNALLPQAGSLILPGISVLIVLLLAQLLKSVRALPVEGEPLMTGVERQTIAYLEQAVPEARVHAQVCMAAIIRPKRGLARREHMATRGRFSQKMIDYVLENRKSGRVIALVELDDRTRHASTFRLARFMMATRWRAHRLTVVLALRLQPIELEQAVSCRVKGVAVQLSRDNRADSRQVLRIT